MDDSHDPSSIGSPHTNRDDQHSMSFDSPSLPQSSPRHGNDAERQNSSSSLHFSDGPDATNAHSERDYSIDEREMRRQLNDVESSFLPDSGLSEVASVQPGADDTYMNLGSTTDTPPLKSFLGISGRNSSYGGRLGPHEPRGDHEDIEAYAYEQDYGQEHDEHSSSQRDSEGDVLDSPSAAAAQRNTARSHAPSSLRNEISARAVSDSVPSRSSSKSFENKRASPVQRSASSGSGSQRSVKRSTKAGQLGIPSVETSSKTNMARRTSPVKRPDQSHNRQISHSSSIGGYSDVSGNSESTINADYALQTGAAAPGDSPLSNRHATRDLSRLPSFGSVASDMSRDPDNGMPAFNRGLSAVSGVGGLSKTKIDEEADLPPITPRAPTSNVSGPAGVTDTVIAQHVSNIHVPDTVAQDFRTRFNRSASPSKISVANTTTTASVAGGTRPQSTLTLKEQNSKIDKLTKENFDLKLKIHFLDQALQSRSDEGVKDMISRSVSLQTDLAKERRDNQSLRRRVRDLERMLAEAHEELADVREHQADARLAGHEEMEIQIEELREQLDHAQVRITKLSAENLAKEAERRKMSEFVAAVQRDREGGEAGAAGLEEEVGMWRDLLTEEQGRREMVEDEGRRLREEIAALRRDAERRRREETRSSRVGSTASGVTENGASSVTLVEQLRQENVELRRDLGAQTSMLTSRNRERERLQQEIEDLKLFHRKAGRDSASLAGDSILERSASRAARAPSRVSGVTGVGSRVSEAERDEYERREGLLRDENAQLRLEVQDLERDAVDKMDYIAQLEEDVKNAEMDLNAAVEDLRALQKERDDALLTLEMKEADYDHLANDYKRLEEEAVLNIEGLEDNVAQYETSRNKFANDLKTRNDEFAALQTELRALGTKFLQLETDRETSLKRIEILERELDDANTELEALERKLRESDQKNQRLEVQSESLQNEITFLREEQEIDKVKIGDLTNALHAAQQAVQDEKEKMQELEASLIEERRQREMIDDQSKQEVQQVINELNTENSKQRDELRKIRRNVSTKENEAATYKSRLEDLEANLRHALGDQVGARSTLLQDVEKMQYDLSQTLSDLDAARADVADKDRLIKSRDVLLESSGLEARRLSDLLDKERQARKHDAHNFDMAQRGNSTHLRAIANHETRTLELETALSQAKRRAANLENQYKEQLQERNALLLSLWNRLSTLCGAEWAQRNSAIGAERTTSMEGIAKYLPQFQRNVLAAIKQIESLFSGLKTRIRAAERTMSKDVATLSHTLDSKTARLDKLERSTSELVEVNTQLRAAIANSQLSASTSTRSPSALSNLAAAGPNKLTKMHQEEMNRLRGEVKSLKSELKIHRQHPSSEAADRIAADPSLAATGQSRRSSVLGLMGVLSGGSDGRSGSRDGGGDQGGVSKLSPANIANKILRHHSEGAVRTLGFGQGGGGANNRASGDYSALATRPPRESMDGAAAAPRPSTDTGRQGSVLSTGTAGTAGEGGGGATSSAEQRWMHRLRELERRLKAEREARLLDRRGARQRLEERGAENEELRAELERERERSRHGSVSSFASFRDAGEEEGGGGAAGKGRGNQEGYFPDVETPRASIGRDREGDRERGRSEDSLD